MADKKKVSTSLRKKVVLRNWTHGKSLLVGTLLLLLSIAIVCLFGKYSKTFRENSRQDLMAEIKIVAEEVYESNGKYPSAVLFSQDQALICEDIDCLKYQAVKIGKYARSISGSNTKTSTSYTKYDYELAEDGYKLGYCDEDGKVKNFGTSQESIILMCN